jgi:hypothetical protein
MPQKIYRQPPVNLSIQNNSQNMAIIKKIISHIINALTGWIIGVFTTLILGFLWLNVIPVVDRTGQGPGLLSVIWALILMVSPFSIIGGFLGGMIPKEGGRKDQAIYAGIIGALLTTPFALFLFWYTGF